MIVVNTRDSFLIEVKARMPVNCMAVELGVLYGDFSNMILNVLEPGKLVLVDPYIFSNETYGSAMNYLTTSYSTFDDYQSLIKRFVKEITNNIVKVVRDYSYSFVNYCDANSFDFIYIDGSHLHEDVKRDLNDWLPKLKTNGLMCGHDYIEHESFGVIQAVDEFCKENNFEIIILNENGGDYALRAIR